MILPITQEVPIEPLYQTAIVETIEIATPKQTEPQPELSAEEQLKQDIENNVNNCNTDTHWISAEDASCLPKRTQTVNVSTQRQNTARGAVNTSSSPSLSWWASGNCTWYVASQRPVGYWNDASSWLWQAQRDGWATGTTPQVGAIAWEPNHVSLVIAVNGSNITVSEMNYKGYGVVSTRTAPASQFKFIY